MNDATSIVFIVIFASKSNTRRNRRRRRRKQKKHDLTASKQDTRPHIGVRSTMASAWQKIAMFGGPVVSSSAMSHYNIDLKLTNPDHDPPHRHRRLGHDATTPAQPTSSTPIDHIYNLYYQYSPTSTRTGFIACYSQA